MLRELGNLDPLLLPRVAIADRHCFILERLMVHRNTKRSTDLILPRVKFSDAARIIVNSAQHRLQRALDRLRHADDLRLVLREWQDRSLDGSQLWSQFQNN